MAPSIEPLRPRVFLYDRTGVTLYHTFDAFNPGASGIHILKLDVKLAQQSPGSFSMLIEDSDDKLNPGIVPGVKVVIQAGKTQATLANLITGFVRKKKTIRRFTGALEYQISGLGAATRFNERISNFFRMGARLSFGSAVATADPNMRVSELLKDLVQDTDHMPVGGPLEDFTVSAIEDIAETIPSIREPFVPQSHIANQLADNTGTLWGVDQNGSVFMRYPTDQHSGVTIKDTSSPSDDANTCLFTGPWAFEDSIDIADGFANRIYGIGGTEFAVDQSQIIDGGSGSLHGTIRSMQFIPTQRRLNALSLLLHRNNNPLPVIGEIVAGGATPDAGALVGTFKIDQDQIGQTATVVDRIPLNIADSGLQVGVPHWLTLFPIGGDAGNTIFWHHDNLTTHISQFKDGNSAWVAETKGYCFVTYNTNKVLAVADDSQSIEKFGVFETVMNLPWILEGKMMDRYLVAILNSTAQMKRVYEIKEISLPDKLIFPNQMVTLTDTKSGLLNRDVEMNSVEYHFDVDKLAIGLNPGPLVQPIEYVGASQLDEPEEPPEPPQPDLPTPLRTITVPLLGGLGNWAALVAAVNAAIPGDHIIATDGVYTKNATTFTNRDGTAANPIVVKAQTVGGVTINGTGLLHFNNCDYLQWYGFVHRHAADNAQAIRFDTCTNCRFARNDVQLTGSSASYWLMIGSLGTNNRVDHNYFHDKTTDDAFLLVSGFSGNLSATNTLIEYNYFKNNTGIGETIVLGASTLGAQFANSIFRHNLVEGMSGVPPDGEMLGLKTCGNIVFHNTFKNNLGNTVSLRHGINNKVMCNFFDTSGGIIISGSGHVILRNHFKGYNNTTMPNGWMNPIILRTGDTEVQPPGAGYARVTNCTISLNSIINGNGASGPTIPMVKWGYASGTTHPPTLNTFEGNVITASTGMMFDFTGVATAGNNTFINNVFFASGSAVYGDLTVGTHYVASDPLVTLGADGLYRIASGSPARNKVAIGKYNAHLTTDIDGENMAALMGDAGSDQYSTAAIVAMPLKVVTSAVVGPASP